MLEAAGVFAIQFCYVLLLGLQSINVNRGRYVWAGGTSLMLGVMGFHVTGTIAAARGDEGGLVWWAYILAGPCGIVSSMVYHFHVRNLK